jgi:hypothetical protein
MLKVENHGNAGKGSKKGTCRSFRLAEQYHGIIMNLFNSGKMLPIKDFSSD